MNNESPSQDEHRNLNINMYMFMYVDICTVLVCIYSIIQNHKEESALLRLWSLFGSVEEAWRSCFNRSARLRISRDDFVQACEGLRFRCLGLNIYMVPLYIYVCVCVCVCLYTL